jgi:hypothetical protein
MLTAKREERHKARSPTAVAYVRDEMHVGEGRRGQLATEAAVVHVAESNINETTTRYVGGREGGGAAALATHRSAKIVYRTNKADALARGQEGEAAAA